MSSPGASARNYSDGIAHALELPHAYFTHQRSGETLGMLQKVRTDVEGLIKKSISVFFSMLFGIVFVAIYATSVHWTIVPAFLLALPLLGLLGSVVSRRIKEIQKEIFTHTTALAGSTTESLRNIELVKSLGLTQQEITRLNGTTTQLLTLELKKMTYLRTLTFLRGTGVHLIQAMIIVLTVYLIYTQAITIGQFTAVLFMHSSIVPRRCRRWETSSTPTTRHRRR